MAAPGAGNQILQDLAPSEIMVFQPFLEEVTLRRGSVVAEAGQPSQSLYFPVTAVLSLVGGTESGATVEVAVVGPEGMASVSAALGRARLPFRVVTQIEGTAWRIPTNVVVKQLQDCELLHERLLSYAHRVIAEVGQSAICNRFHTARQRLARWLLITAERSRTRALPLTHEFIAYMVGGPRSAVTEAAAALRKSGAIDYRRGLVTIKSARRLRQEACECYEAVAALESQ